MWGAIVGYLVACYSEPRSPGPLCFPPGLGSDRLKCQILTLWRWLAVGRDQSCFGLEVEIMIPAAEKHVVRGWARFQTTLDLTIVLTAKAASRMGAMSYVTAGTTWPDLPIPRPFQALVEKLLEIGDSGHTDAGYRMATEIFSPDGVLDHGSYKFVGTEEITNCRNKAKPGRPIVKRRHQISRAYSQTSKGDDFVVIGELTVEFDNGKTLQNPLAARAVVDESTIHTEPRLKLWTLYVDMAPMIAAAGS
ncbi:hypothetical protein CLAIMM_04988 isoform 1 [Cladophialophora immunda]|nr:hypothetical protein CLAIMM_04988 isoform 1 [Cladophialophora immunda]